MRIGGLVLLAALLALAPRAFAQECPGCVLGLYADPEMTRTQALPEGDSLSLYLGIRYGSEGPQELSGIEFSITGLDSFLVLTRPLDEPPAALGTPATPVGTDTLWGQGGMNIAWGRCLAGDRPLVRFTLFPRGAWPAATALKVKRRYPPTNPASSCPTLYRCDDPYFSAACVAGGVFALGPAGAPRCSLDVPQQEFPMLAEGEKDSLAFTVTNVGGGVLEGLPSTDSADFRFTGEHSLLLAHGRSKKLWLLFSPVHPGPETCTVTTAATCGTLVFTGRAPDVLPIASVLAAGDALVGQRITIEGQVTVTASATAPTAWLQDASGHGMPVVPGTTALNLLLRDRGNRVHASGPLTRVAGSLYLSRATGISVLSSGNPWIEPVPLTAAAAKNPMWAGVLVEVEGQVLSRIPNASGSARYRLQDASGWVDVITGDFGTVANMVATGAALADTTGAIYARFAGGALTGPACGVRRITVGTGQDIIGKQVDVPVRVDWNRTPIDSLRMRVSCDSRVARCVGATSGGLTAGWPPPVVQEVSPDTVLVTAAGSPAIAPGSTGEFLMLRFEITGCAPGATVVTLPELGADLVELETCDGRITCTACAANGDVNRDGVLTPGDARCAFAIFLAGGATVPPICDVPGLCEIAAGDFTCDLQITPADALGILRRWLGGNSTPRACTSASKPRSANAGTVTYRLNLERATWLDAVRVAVPIEMRTTPGPAAFGLDLRFDPAGMEFVELRVDAAGKGWAAIDARLLEAGRVRAGGFVPDVEAEASSSDWTSLAQLVFRSTSGDISRLRPEWIEQISGSFASEELPARLSLSRPHPNPMLRTVVQVELAIPSGEAQRVEAQVLDVRGRRVRTIFAGSLAPGLHTLRWDGRDARSIHVAAGIYVLQVRVGSQVEKRKLVVLE